MIEAIYGVDCTVPDVPNAKFIAKGRRFEYQEVPDIFDELEYDDDGTPLYDEEQLDYINAELERVDNGYWFYNQGKLKVPTYITGLHYFYLNYWTLESGERPSYRDADRRWFIFYDTVRNDPRYYGVIRIKKRREGATSQATCAMYYRAMRFRNSNCGVVSKTNKDAEDVFLKMIMKGHRDMVEFMKPRVEDDDAKTILRFRKRKGKKTVKVKGKVRSSSVGMESIIEFRSTALNSFDSGRLTELLLDEGGKYPAEVPINKYWPIVKKTLTRGAVKVGFCQMPSTVNESAKGGAGFKKLWENSVLDEATGLTATGLIQYFCPADDGLEGFIDEYGISIRDTPTVEQASWMRKEYGIKGDIGAREFILRSRELITDDALLNEEVRMMPLDEREAFMIDDAFCYVNAAKVEAQISWMDANEKKWLRRVRFYWKNPDDFTQGVDWRDDPNGDWEMLYDCPQELRNGHVVDANGRMRPANKLQLACGVDPFKSSQTIGKGSKGCCWIGRRYDPLDPKNSCQLWARFLGRTKMKRDFYMQVLMGCVYYGCAAGFERDAGDDYLEQFMALGMKGYLARVPDSAIKKDQTQLQKEKKSKIFGIQSGDSFALGVMLELLKQFVEDHIDKCFWKDQLEELLIYDHEDRTKFDMTCALMALLPYLVGDTKPVKQKKETKIPLLRTYSLN